MSYLNVTIEGIHIGSINKNGIEWPLIAFGGFRFLKMLEAGADPNTVSTGSGSGFAVGMTPLLAASSWGKVDAVRLLIAAGADLHVRTPNMQQTAMHLVAGGNIESCGVDKTMGLLRLLVQKAERCQKWFRGFMRDQLRFRKFMRAQGLAASRTDLDQLHPLPVFNTGDIFRCFVPRNPAHFQAPELLSEKNAQGKTPLDCAKYEKKRQQDAYLSSLPR